MKRQETLSFLSILVIICMQNAVALGKRDASWIQNPYKDYSEKQYIAAVGSGASTDEADKNATAAVSRVLSQNVESNENVVQSDSSDGNSFSKYLATVNTHSSVDSISGISIKDRCCDKSGKYYARAVVERAEAAKQYALLFSQNEVKIRSLIASATSKNNSFEKCAQLISAYTFSKQNDTYTQLINVLDASYNHVPSYVSSAEVGRAAQNALGAITISMSVEGDQDNRIETALSSVINDTGIAITNTKDAPYILTCTISFEDAGQNEAAIYVRYVMTASLKETDTEKEILNISANGRQGKLSKVEAEQSAMRTLEKKVRDEFSTKFISLLETSSNK